eukprot:6193922-Pleurochrysis_carterae.AAC.5
MLFSTGNLTWITGTCMLRATSRNFLLICDTLPGNRQLAGNISLSLSITPHAVSECCGACGRRRDCSAWKYWRDCSHIHANG